MSSDHQSLHALCEYGLPPEHSEKLMRRYGHEDLVPLSELDSTQGRGDDY